MAVLCNRAGHYIFALWFLLLSIFFFSSPNLSRHRLDVYHTSTQYTWCDLSANLWDAGLKRAARGSLKIQDAKTAKNSPSGHHITTSSGYILTTEARIDNRKKNLLSSNISSTCPHNMANFGPLAAEIGSVVWGTQANFNGFRVLAALLHDTPAVGVNQTLRR